MKLRQLGAAKSGHQDLRSAGKGDFEGAVSAGETGGKWEGRRFPASFPLPPVLFISQL